MPDKDSVLLARIDERVKNILDELKSMNGDLRVVKERVRILERWRWILTGMITAISLIFGGKFIFF